jgi:glutathione peroxidase
MMKLRVFALAFFAFSVQSVGFARAQTPQTSALDFTFEAINGKPLPLAQYRGKVLLVVNTASQCGYTPQYEALQKLWQTYKDRGLVVIGVPSNDFGGQEPGSEAEIAGFCKGVYGVTFPLTAKYHVKGREAHPFFKWAAGEAGSKGAPFWNFHKYLIGADGRLAAWFPTATAPDADLVVKTIERELASVKAGS